MSDLISVIVPVYKTEKYLNKCIESIVNQTYKNLEIILVDDGSPDNCPQMCDEWAKKDSRVKVIHKQNGGLSDARNAGLDIAQGEYMTFIDSDDWVDLDYVEYLMNLIKENNVALSMCWFAYDNGNVLKNHVHANDSETFSSKECLRRLFSGEDISVTTWGKMFQKQLFENVRFPFGKIHEDNGTTHKFILQCDKVAVSYLPKYIYRVNEQSIMHMKFSSKKFDAIEMTDLSANEVASVFPDLYEEAILAKIGVRRSLIEQMEDAESFKKERQEMFDFIRENKAYYFHNKNISLKSKFGFWLMLTNYSVYRVVKKVWNVVKGRKG